MTLGQKIKRLRVEKELTQKELADQLHVTFQTVSKWENDENEPDIQTLKELAKLYDCSIDYLLSEEEKKQEEPAPVVIPGPVQKETIIIHENGLHVCNRCKKDIQPDDLAIDKVCTRHAGRGHTAEYRDDYYHRQCLDEVNKEREEAQKRLRAAKAKRAKKLSFGWGIAGGIVALIVSMLVFLMEPNCAKALHPAIAVVLAIGCGYGIFAMLYCIISGSFIGDVFLWASGLSIKLPGIIFSWDLEGLAFLIVMKIFFAVLGFMIGVFVLGFAVALSASLAMVSFPFILIHNIHTNYADAY